MNKGDEQQVRLLYIMLYIVGKILLSSTTTIQQQNFFNSSDIFTVRIRVTISMRKMKYNEIDKFQYSLIKYSMFEALYIEISYVQYSFIEYHMFEEQFLL